MNVGDVVIVINCGTPNCACIGKVGAINTINSSGIILHYHKGSNVYQVGTIPAHVRMATPEEVRVFEFISNLQK